MDGRAGRGRLLVTRGDGDTLPGPLPVLLVDFSTSLVSESVCRQGTLSLKQDSQSQMSLWMFQLYGNIIALQYISTYLEL